MRVQIQCPITLSDLARAHFSCARASGAYQFYAEFVAQLPRDVERRLSARVLVLRAVGLHAQDQFHALGLVLLGAQVKAVVAVVVSPC